MSLNIGTLVGSTIRPIDSNDLISTAWDNEIKGGHHSYATLSERDSLIVQRRSWGMLCTVYNDGGNNATYKLEYGYSSPNIMDNSNWILFNKTGGVDEWWLEPVKSIELNEPISPTDGDRYLAGLDSSDVLSGTNWNSLVGGYILEWNSLQSDWIQTEPKNGYSVRVDDEGSLIYKYLGDWPTGKWVKDYVNSVMSISATTSNGIDYVATSNLELSEYSTERIYLVKFGATNSGVGVTLDINGMGVTDVKQQKSGGIDDIYENELNPNLVYPLLYDGVQFLLNKPIGDDGDIKWRIRVGETVVVPDYTEYLVYGDLIVEGNLNIGDFGKVVIINGNLIIDDGVVTNAGNVQLVTLLLDQSTNSINLTHNDFIYKVSTNSLLSGKFYLITDFRTIYPQPDYSDASTPKVESSLDIKSGVIEPLLALATSMNTISNIVYSPNYPFDYIEYDWRVETYNSVNTRGKITRRRDAVGNDFPFDFRNVKFKRYETDPGVFDSYWDNGNLSSEFYCLDGYTPSVPDDKYNPSSYQYFYQNNFVRLNWRSQDGYSVNNEIFDIWSFNSILKRDGVLVTNNTFEGLIDNNIFTNPRNNTFDGVISRNIFYIDVNENKFEGIIYDNKFYGSVYGNTINTTNFSLNIFQSFNNNFIQSALINVNAFDTLEFSNNIANQSDIGGIVFTGGGDVKGNEFLGSTVGSGVTFGTPFSNNQFYGEFKLTDVGNNFNNNIIKIIFNNCVGVGDNFQKNIISRISPYTDFSTASHVYFDYDCEIFRNSDNQVRLRYVDELDATVITDVNS